MDPASNMPGSPQMPQAESSMDTNESSVQQQQQQPHQSGGEDTSSFFLQQEAPPSSPHRTYPPSGWSGTRLHSPPLPHYQHHYHHHPQRPLSTYTALGSPRTSTGRTRSLSLGNAPYQQKVLPVMPTNHQHAGMVMGNPQASSGGMFLPLTTMTSATASPPDHQQIQQHKAMEAASAAERTRAKELEEQEANMTADELRAVLKKERHRTAKIQADLAALRSGTVQQQFEAEVLEEGRINGLMRRMDDLQEEKGRIILELEREEEMLTNTLQKKLNQVRREKSQLEEQIEHEKKTSAVLQTQLSGIRSNKLMATSEALEEEDEMEEED